MSQKRILVVEDERVTREGVRRILENADYVVTAAASGKEALDLIKKVGLPHLALVDIEMPGMTGFELSKKILQFSDLPIIMLTGVSDEDAVVAGLREYAEDYVTKPFRRAGVVGTGGAGFAADGGFWVYG